MIKEIIQKILNKLGYQIITLKKRQNNRIIDKSVENDWISKLNIKTFIDIGANVGEYIDFALINYPDSKIYAFEPLKDCYEHLKQKELDNENVKVFNLAIGDSDCSNKIYKSSYAPSSSLLKMGKLHIESFPGTKGFTVENIEVSMLDSFFKNYQLEKDIFIKVDTQGYEDKVIAGGIETFKKAKIILIEVSFFELYEKQLLFHDIYNKLYNLGFIFHGIKNQVVSPKDGTILQAHAYFINQELD